MKRRKRRARHAGRRDAFHLTMIAVLMTVLCLMIVNIKEPEQTEEEQPETTHAEVVQNPETIVQTAEETESKYKVFDGMSEDWGSDDLEGFVFYKLPEQYADKGYFPEKCRYTQDVYASKMTFPMPLYWQSSSMNPDMNLTRSETAGSQRDICRFMRNGTLTG